MRKNKEKLEIIFLDSYKDSENSCRFLEELESKGIFVHSHHFPLLKNKSSNLYLLESINKLQKITNKLEKRLIPYLILSHSFSSILVDNFDFSNLEFLRGIILFSPILDKNNYYMIEQKNTGNDEGDFENNNFSSYFQFFDKILYNNIPLSILYSEKDKRINIHNLSKSIEKYRDTYSRGKIFSIKFKFGNHNIDSFYNNSVRNLILSFVAREKVLHLLGKECYIFLWGSSQVVDFFKNKHSDIDLFVLSNDYVYKFTELSKLQTKFKQKYNVKLDLSLNNLSDLQSSKISRFNRGPILAQGVNQHFFSIDKNKIFIDVNYEDVIYDCYMATLINYRECEKKISRLNGSDEQLRRFAKLYSISIFYLLHIRGIKNIDMNNLNRWLDIENDKKLIEALEISRDILRGKKNSMQPSKWLKILNGMEDMLKEEEHILNIKYNHYDTHLLKGHEVVDTPGNSKVTIVRETSRVVKQYYIDNSQTKLDSKRITQHYNQLKILEKIGIKIPSNIELIDNNSTLIMDLVEGKTIHNLITKRDENLENVFDLLAKSYIDLYSKLQKLNIENIIINNDNLNYHCARNFTNFSTHNFLKLGDSSSEKKIKEIIKKLNLIIEENPKLLENNDLIYGDYKPENLILSPNNLEITYFDPMISKARVSCDIGRMISRIMIINPDIYLNEMSIFNNKVVDFFGDSIFEESKLMAIFDMSNLFSRDLSKFMNEKKLEEIKLFESVLSNCFKRLVSKNE